MDIGPTPFALHPQPLADTIASGLNIQSFKSVAHGVSKQEHAIGKMRGLSMDINGQHSSLFIYSIIPIYKRDFLGIFTDKIRFSVDLSTTYSIPGPIKHL